jgi:hypothetical protein
MKSLQSLITLAILTNSAQAWFGTGHLLVARIAYDKLTQEDQETIDKV